MVYFHCSILLSQIAFLLNCTESLCLIKSNACDHILLCICVDSRCKYYLFPLFVHGVWYNFTGEYVMHNLFLWGHKKACWIILRLDDICSRTFLRNGCKVICGATFSEMVTFTCVCRIGIFCATQTDGLSTGDWTPRSTNPRSTMHVICDRSHVIRDHVCLRNFSYVCTCVYAMCP